MDYREVETIATKLLALGRATVAEFEAGTLENATLLELCRDLLAQPADEVVAAVADGLPTVAADEPETTFAIVEPVDDTDDFTPRIIVDPVDTDDITAPEPMVSLFVDDVKPEEPLVVDVAEEEPAVDEVFASADSQPAFDPFQAYEDEVPPVVDVTPPEVKPNAPAICPQCHTPLRPRMRFCTTCGLKVGDSPTPPPPIVPTKQCNSCYATLPEDALFCTSCGSSVTQPPPAMPAAPPAVTPFATSANDKFCDTCGLGVSVEVVTCPSCHGNQFS